MNSASKPFSPHKVINNQDMQKLISRNLFISVSAKVFNLVTRLFMPPLVLSFVGLEEYGLWTICFIIIGHLNLGAFGVSNVYVRYIASYYATDEIEKINGLISTGIVLVTTINIILLSILWFLVPTLVKDIFHISPNLHDTATVLFYGTASMFMFSTSFNAFPHLLNGLQKIAETSMILVGCMILETILIVIFLFNGAGIYALLYAFIIRQIISFIIHLVLSFHFMPTLSLGFSHFDRSYFKLFYRFGAIVQLSSILGIILRSIDKLIASITLSVKATALLSIGTKFPAAANGISSSMNGVFLPAISYMHSQHRQSEIFDMYLQGARTICLLMGFILGFLAAFAAPLTVAWLGTDEKYQMVPIIMMLFTVPRQLHSLSGMAGSYFKGIEKPAYSLLYSGGRLILLGFIALIIFTLFEVSILSIVVVIVLSTIIGALAYLIYVNHFIGVPQMTYLKRVILPGFVVSYGVAYLLFWLLTPWVVRAMENRWYAVGFILVSGILYSFLTLAIIYKGIFDDQERNRLRQQAQKIIRVIFYNSQLFKKEKQSIH
jgi:O-antigen/teichoic acid export membrane protein